MNRNNILLKPIYYCEGGLKSPYDNIISALDDFYDQWDPTEEMCGPQETMLKNKPH